MNTEQQIRAAAAAAAGSCAQSIGHMDPDGFLRVCSMIEVYITTGEEAAMEVVKSWDAPQAAPQPPAAPSPQEQPNAPQAADDAVARRLRAQALADRAHAIKVAADLQPIIDEAKLLELSTEKVSVGNITGPLGTYLNNCWYQLSAFGSGGGGSKGVPLHERNKHQRSGARADLGL